MLLWPVLQSPPESLRNVLAAPCLSGAQVGVCVTDESGTVLFEKDSKIRFVPASNQKVMSVLFALETLGPSFQPVTKVWKEKGHVVVTTTGDPSLTLGQLRDVKEKLGLNKGWTVHIRAPFKPATGPGWEWDDLPWYYAAPTAPLGFDRSAFEVWASGGKLETLPHELGVKVVRASGNRTKAEFDPVKSVLTVSGPLPKSRTSLGKFAQSKPLHAVASALGGPLSTREKPVPQRLPDATITGWPMAKLAKVCLEDSDNVIAEQVLLLGATKHAGLPNLDHGTASAIMKKVLCERAGLDESDFRPVDGSGLSRHNQLTPAALCRALAWAMTRPYRDLWHQAQAGPGEGTMKRRLKDSTFLGKTGTMDAVVSLSGTVKTKEGKRLFFSFLVNNSLAPASEVRSVQDRFVQALESGQDLDEPRSSAPRHPSRAVPQPFHSPAPWHRVR